MKSANFISGIAGVMLAVYLSGCASVVSGSVKRLAVKTDPTGAKVTVYDLKHPVYDKITPKVAIMYTPCEIPLRTGGRYKTERYFVTIEKTGHKPVGFEVHSTVNGWYFGNLHPLALATMGPFAFPIGMGIIDPMTGAMWTLEPDTPQNLYEIQDLSKIPDENVDAPIIQLMPSL